MSQFKTWLLGNQFTRPIINYYNNFRDDYRLRERVTEVKTDESSLSFPEEAITLIVIAEKDVDRTHWLEGLGDWLQRVEEVIWLGGKDSNLDVPGGLSGRIKPVSSPGQPKGQEVNRIIQNAKGSIVVLMNAQVEPSPDWLVNILSPFKTAPKTLFSLGRLEFASTWRTLALYRQMWSSLPYWGFAFRKQAWARAGGLPDSLPLYPAWMLFSLRMKSLPGEYVRSSSAVACFDTQANPTLILRQAYQEGSVGLFGDSARKEIPLWALVFILIVPGIILFFFAKVAWLGLLVGLCFLFAIFVAGKRSSQGVVPKPDIFQILLMGTGRLLHVIGYAMGTLVRNQTRLSMEKEHENNLREIFARKKDTKNIIVYLPTHDWSFMFQRPQQLARHFAREGYLFFYCTRNEQRDAFVGFQEVEPNLFVCATPPETFSIIQHPILLIGSPWYAPMLDWFHEPLVIYDHYDDLEVSSARLEDHQKLVRDSVVVLTSSQKLLQAIRNERPDVLFIPNAVDYSFVQKMRPSYAESPPEEFQDLIQKGKPIIGYTGALAGWFDYELVKGLADVHPEWQFVLIGIDYDDSLRRSGLTDCHNVSWLGWKPYPDLFKYVWNFSITMIPFIINDVTKATSPVKLFEYFACQKPVVATPLPECMRYPEVFIASDINTFSLQIMKALRKKDSPRFLRELDEVARQNTWAARVQQITEALTSAERRRSI